ncbi:plasmid recombination protein [Candidatus Halocynthiibacter alkanivorans]|uniref:plasmid recombination protein n=1 Tax=Candidatus Halocynthiibacter alkanivorans TaxID=2267619 RepID=UPI001358FD13|nr:plasmid recombination protein [Candidatus Halocynthiibacter alkanivorans]
MASDKQHPVVLRMAGMFPADLASYEGHRTRKGGDLGHIDTDRSHLNRSLIGETNWAQQARAEIENMRAENFASELESLNRRRRKGEMAKRIVEGPRDPWRATRHGPLREVILTAHHDWFATTDTDSIEDLFGESRQDRFEQAAVAWLQQTFGDDVIHARADLDETTYHIHAIVMPRAQTKDGRKMLQPSKHAAIKDYEAAQDSIGEWFADLGLTRGKKRKQALRDAVQHNLAQQEVGSMKDADQPESPEHIEHVSPRQWREKQERQLVARGQSVAQREDDASAVLKTADAVAKGDPQILETLAKAKDASLATSLFKKALLVLRARARKEARKELRKEFDEIKAADDAIVAVAASLPERARRDIIKARTSIALRITRLKSFIGKWQDPKQHNDPDR